ncbi:MAG: hypothetical protein NZ108_10335, partial [Bacteroidia bacterium]|nr:hypothetical protein [Bacteroidia bacterium]
MKKWLGLIVLVVSSCKGFLGEKTSTSFIDVPQYDSKAVALVPVQPALTGFSKPVDVLAGFDELIYVADEGAGQIISFDQSGRELGRFSLSGVKALAQCRNLNLLAIAKFDTIISGQTYRLDAIFRLELNGSGGYGLRNATIIRKTIHPFYFRTAFTASDVNVSLNRIAVLADDSYYVTRNGTNNSILQFGGPDDSVLLFDSQDRFQYPLIVQTSQGQISDYFKKPFGITTLVKPPQSPFISNRMHFIVTSLDANTTLKVQYINGSMGEEGPVYELNSN